MARRSLTKSTHNAALEVVAGTPQEDLLLYHLLLGRHFPSFCAIVTCGKVKECAMTAVKQRLRLVGKCRASCGCSKEGCRIEKNEGYGSEGRHARSAQVRQRAQPVWIPTLTWNQDLPDTTSVRLRVFTRNETPKQGGPLLSVCGNWHVPSNRLMFWVGLFKSV